MSQNTCKISAVMLLLMRVYNVLSIKYCPCCEGGIPFFPVLDILAILSGTEISYKRKGNSILFGTIL